jgi:hypothetical protein
MANRLTKYTGTPDNTKRFSLNPFSGIIDDPIGWLEDHSPVGVAQGFVDEITGGDGSGLGADIAGKITDTLTNQDEVDQAYNDAAETLAKQRAAASEGYNQASEAIGETRGEIADLIGPETMAMYKHNLLFLNPENYTADTSPIAGFNFDRDVSKYMDPNAEYVIDQSVKAAQQAMSGQGGMTGGAAARALQAEASAKASELYGDAFDRMMKATEQEYGKERDIALVEQDIAKQMADREKNRMDYLGNLGGMYVGNLQGKNEDLINLLMARMGTNLSLAQAMAQLGIDRASMPTTFQQGLTMAGQAAQIANAVK